jgi:hypothetical protein
MGMDIERVSIGIGISQWQDQILIRPTIGNLVI